MPDETRDENGAAGAAGGTDVVGNAIRLKKAGVPIVWALVVALAGAPGFWEAFLDRSDDEAKVAARVSYELMKANVEALAKANEKQEAQLDRLRDTVNALVIRRGGDVLSGAGTRPISAIPEPANVVTAPTLPSNLDALVEDRLGD